MSSINCRAVQLTCNDLMQHNFVEPPNETSPYCKYNNQILQLVISCLYLAAWADGKEIRTLEGLLGPNGELSDIQQAFVDEAAIQCGFCTPGFIMTAVEILETGKRYTDDELNTIVEERRTENKKARSRESHIPAVAPSMQVRARSETLNDIGSALSRPLISSPPPASASNASAELDFHPQRSTSTSRVPGWLSGVNAPTAAQMYPGGDPFYRCSTTPPPHQETLGAVSASSSFTALDSASYTLESSPTPSKRYSRSLMITPLPVGETEIVGGGGVGEGRVGVAL